MSSQLPCISLCAPPPPPIHKQAMQPWGGQVTATITYLLACICLCPSQYALRPYSPGVMRHYMSSGGASVSGGGGIVPHTLSVDDQLSVADKGVQASVVTVQELTRQYLRKVGVCVS
jgi:hypothetical protein